MAGGYITPVMGEWDPLVQEITAIKDRLAELERPSGTQTAQALSQIRSLVDDLAAEVAALAASGVTWAGPVSTSGLISSTDVYNFDVTTLPGARRTVSVHVSGRFGQTVSTIVKKTNESPVPFTAANILACMPFVFHYIAQKDIRDNPENPNYDPGYVVPWDIGFMAEHLIANGLELFVFYNDDGSPAGINYAEFGAVAASVIGRDHDERISALERAVQLRQQRE